MSDDRPRYLTSSGGGSCHRHSGSPAQRASPEIHNDMAYGPAPRGASTMCNRTSWNDERQYLIA
jgi:hypothetical protein